MVLRIKNGYAIFQSNRITPEVQDPDLHLYTVINPVGETYTVSMIEDFWKCNCPDFTYRSGRMRDEGASFLCKHIYGVLFLIGDFLRSGENE
jgi:hypothetical protein